MIADDWKPTVASINALPEPLRLYIHDIETLCDPQHLVQKIAYLQESLDGLAATIRNDRLPVKDPDKKLVEINAGLRVRIKELEPMSAMSSTFLALLNRIEIEEDSSLASQCHDIAEKHGLTVHFGEPISGETH